MNICCNMESADKYIGSALRKQEQEFEMDFITAYSREIALLWKKLLGTKNATVLDVVSYLNQSDKPIFVMNDKAVVLAKKS